MRFLAVAVLLYASAGLVFAMQGRPNVDEGMFLSAAQQVATGALPYQDFPFAQGPMLPYAYVAAPTWDGSALLGGRLLAWLAGVAGMASALWLAYRLGGHAACAFALLLGLATLPNLWVGNTVRAQAIATPLLIAGVAVLARRPAGTLGWAFAPSLLLWSTAVRLTNLPVFVLVAAWTAWRLRSEPRVRGRVAALLGVQGLLAFLPVVVAPSAAWYHIVTVQLTRGERIGYVASLGFAGDLRRKLVGYLDLAGDGALLLGAVAIVAIGWTLRRHLRGRLNLREPLSDPRSGQLTLLVFALAAFAPHLLLGNAFLEYLVPFWALLVPAAAIGLGRALEGRAALLRWGLVGSLTLATGVHAYRDRDIWIGSGPASMASFRAVARQLAADARPDCRSITFLTHLAVEAGCPVLPGLEYSKFSYLSKLPVDEARRRGVLDLDLLRERVVEHRPDWIALAAADPRLLVGREIERKEGAGLIVPVVPWLAFLGDDARNYVRQGNLEIPSGVRRPGERNAVPVTIFTRRPTGASRSR